MAIRLTPELEQLVEDELRSGRFRNAEEVIAVALRKLHEQLHASNHDPGKAVSEMQKFIETNSVRLEGLSVKELIHEGHRL